MFTGLVEEVGRIREVREAGNGLAFTIEAETVLEDLRPGDSIAVDGVCQTVVELALDSFSVQAVATTLGRTTFGEYRAGRRVNLERSLALGARMGGHLVQGHVDGVGIVRSVDPREELVLIDFSLPPIIDEVTVLHGSITVNGVSLTVNAVPGPGAAQVSIIPHTWSHTALPELRTGQKINLEGDMIGKYVRHLLRFPLRNTPGSVDSHLLRAWGYERGE
ncbi:riboflavin synthase subunit alpha [soil metagenome]|nr:riboflavin synthase [Gemmatimonadota bacterium]